MNDFTFRIGSLPAKPGIYMFKDKQGNILYVGKANNLKSRIRSYFTKSINLGEKTKSMLLHVSAIDNIVVENEFEAFLLEANLIKKYRPRYNVRFTDGKAYPFIKITIKDKYPVVLQARRADEKKALFFGPYPTIGAMHAVLKIVRRIFPFQSVLRHDKRPCLYYHIGLCPCPHVFDTQEMLRGYKKNIRYLVQFLQGKKQNVLKKLFKDMQREARKENFEEAEKIKKQIESIQFITQQFKRPIEYLENPDLVSDQRQKELLELKKVLFEYALDAQNLNRIECYDISNIQGRHATGSMVVFINGEKETLLYRHFKIRVGERPNDTLMMREIIVRRLKHTEWEYPGLIVVDGGKGQVSSVLEVLKDANVDIPVIGLAKRLEEIVLVINNEFKIIRLPRSSIGLHLLERVRDEAHRFAIRYHRKLRSKALFDRSDLF